MYKLPFIDDGKWVLNTGNFDDPIHGHGKGQYYAFDFNHDKGGEVRAARGGWIVFVENKLEVNVYDLPNDNICKGILGAGNAVLIRHLDNTVAAYDHMMTDSITVKKGEWVGQGTLIGMSGNTGNSSDPHLHFELHAYWNNENDWGPSVPTIFEDKKHRAWRPKRGDELHSNNDIILQEDWRWCKKCQGLFFGGNPGSKCPTDGKTHSKTGSANYVLARDSPNAPGWPFQSHWHWCKKCQGLFYMVTGSKCPADGKAHSKSSASYALVYNKPNFPGQHDWRRCYKCQGLFFGGNPGSKCPASSQGHGKGNDNYVLCQTYFNEVQGKWRKCSKCRVLFYGGGPGSKCPVDNGPHNKTGSKNYYITIDWTEYPGNPNFRRCDKCKGLWYIDWKPSKCPVDNAKHSKTGHVYILKDGAQPPDDWNWRICGKCMSLFHGATSPVADECPSTLGTHGVGITNFEPYGVLISSK